MISHDNMCLRFSRWSAKARSALSLPRRLCQATKKRRSKTRAGSMVSIASFRSMLLHINTMHLGLLLLSARPLHCPLTGEEKAAADRARADRRNAAKRTMRADAAAKAKAAREQAAAAAESSAFARMIAELQLLARSRSWTFPSGCYRRS